MQKEEERPVISLYALIKTSDYHTMRVQGRIKNQLVSILINTGSTHNFMDVKVVKTVGERLQCVNSLTVTMANRESLKVQELCPGLT